MCSQFHGERGHGREKQEAVNGGRSKVPWPSPRGRWEGFPGAVTLEVWLEGWVKVWHFNQETEFVLDRRQQSVVLRNRWDCQYAWNTNSRQHLEETEDQSGEEDRVRFWGTLPAAWRVRTFYAGEWHPQTCALEASLWHLCGEWTCGWVGRSPGGCHSSENRSDEGLSWGRRGGAGWKKAMVIEYTGMAAEVREKSVWATKSMLMSLAKTGRNPVSSSNATRSFFANPRALPL